ncbi:efflux transporter outer membrane subunit [Jeongeupia chitinilytica]|uniref:Outer membrane protein n=1 Tax=Jeongeupia chitinilytica TaxID=1041641 RepID=A0ABQ3H2Q6_9NEIS|nr:efflux transporter outer membrane subunit [Jeongeupia chitinilytica]GHD67346.1 outer membrane protein [Jeongeupia chitinilytica]
MMPARGRWAALGVSLLVCACTTLGPDYRRPEVPALDDWHAEPLRALPAARLEADARWWAKFNDPALTRLVEAALERNASVRIAGLRILEARAQQGIAESFLWPQLQQVSGQALGVGQQSGGKRDWYTSVGAGFNLGWEPDFWGRFQRSIESADAGYFATLAQYDDIQVLLAAQVAQLYVAVRTFEAQLQITRDNAALQKRSLEITEHLFRSGNSAELDLQQARTQYLGTLSGIPQLETGLRQSRNALCTLLGRAPGVLPEIAGGTGIIPQGELALVDELPADLVRRRPDVRVAERQLAAQSALIGVSEAELYPSIALIGSIGVSATSLVGGGSTLTLGSFTASPPNSRTTVTMGLGPAISWNVFDHGRLGNQVLVQDARFMQLRENYVNAVLSAAREIDDAATAYAGRHDEIRLLTETGKAAKRALEIANIQYREGMADFQRVLDSQRALFNQQALLVVSRGSMMRDLITLYKAMGGGWQNGRERPLVDAQTDAYLRRRSEWGPLLDTPLPPASADRAAQTRSGP